MAHSLRVPKVNATAESHFSFSRRRESSADKTGFLRAQKNEFLVEIVSYSVHFIRDSFCSRDAKRDRFSQIRSLRFKNWFCGTDAILLKPTVLGFEFHNESRQPVVVRGSAINLKKA